MRWTTGSVLSSVNNDLVMPDLYLFTFIYSKHTINTSQSESLTFHIPIRIIIYKKKSIQPYLMLFVHELIKCNAVTKHIMLLKDNNYTLVFHIVQQNKHS